ncbi:MAG TPA: SMC-Scp complex subunit ScpB, partial [Acidimicrobiales bacterium]
MSTEARRAIEAILMVADQPIEPNLLAQITEIPAAQVEQICAELAAEYEASERGFVLARVAGGYRFQSHPDLAPYVERFVLDGQSARLSSAALETLAIVAYKQPISRAQISSIRGVNADGVLRTLESRGYVREVGRDPGPGNAILYGTTPLFLEKLGLDSLDQLPPLGSFVPGAEVVEQLERTLRVEPAPSGPGPASSHPGPAADDAPEPATPPA